MAIRMSRGIHENHCCNSCGCKYNDKTCPVETGLINAAYPCEHCEQHIKIFVEEFKALTIQQQDMFLTQLNIKRCGCP